MCKKGIFQPIIGDEQGTNEEFLSLCDTSGKAVHFTMLIFPLVITFTSELVADELTCE